MTTDRRPAFLRAFGPRSSTRRAPDLADMGTAFALDEALEPVCWDALAPGESMPVRVAMPVAPWRLWLGRKLGQGLNRS
jgi:hypothetical protein